MKNLTNYNQVIEIPIASSSSQAYSLVSRVPKPLLSHHESSQSRKFGLGRKIITETVKRKLSHIGARMLHIGKNNNNGGVEKVFKKNFTIVKQDEKLIKAYQCSLSTTDGPIQGLLFVSTDRVAFCSDKYIKIPSPATGKLLRIRYKVVIPLQKIKRANASENVKKPSQKYIQLVTEDDFEFWFMGFFNHHKTLTCLQQAII